MPLAEDAILPDTDAALHRLARETPFAEGEVYAAFRTLRPKYHHDREVLEAVARTAKIAIANAYRIHAAADVIAQLAPDVSGPLPPLRPSGVGEAMAQMLALGAPMGAAPSALDRARKSKRKGGRLPPGTIQIEGGQKTPFRLPPVPEPGVPDPAVGRMVAVGQARYHLGTLEELALDAERAIRLEAQEASLDAHRAMLKPILDDAIADLCARVGLPAAAVSFEHSGIAIAKLHDAQHARLVNEDLRRIFGLGAVPASPRVDALPPEPPKGCRSAGCRTLGPCLCDCRKCRAACIERKTPPSVREVQIGEGPKTLVDVSRPTPAKVDPATCTHPVSLDSLPAFCGLCGAVLP